MNAHKHIESEDELTDLYCDFCSDPSPTQRLLLCSHPERTPFLDQPRLRAIDEIVQSYHSPVLIMCDDLFTYHEEEQCMKRVYGLDEYTGKIKMLSEYYKFHNEVPRLFMMAFAETIDNYVDEQRQLEYAKVTKILRREQPEKNKPNKYQPIERLIDSIDLSYEDFEKRDVKKDKNNNKTRKHTMKNLKEKLQVQSTDKIGKNFAYSGKNMKSNKNSESKKICQLPQSAHPSPSLQSQKSSRGLSRQKSKGNLETMVRKNSTKRILTIHHQSANDKNKELKPLNTEKASLQNTTKIRTLSNSGQNPLNSARSRCNSKGLLKTSAAIPLKTIDMNQFGNSKHRQSRTGLHNPIKTQDPEPKRKISTSSRQQSKNSSRGGLTSSYTSNQLLSSQQSSSSNRPARKNVENMFMNVLTMKKNKESLK